MKYTVILLYPDYMADSFGQDTYIAWVTATDLTEAVHKARKEVYKSVKATCKDMDDFFVLFATPGHVENHYQ